MISDIDRAEYKSRVRATLMALLAAVVTFNSTFGLDNAVNDAATFRGASWLVTIGLGLMIVSTGGGMMLSERLRALMNDERTRANRARALSAGFLAAMLTAAALYVITWSNPIEVRAALRLVTGLGLAAALAWFAMLEFRD